MAFEKIKVANPIVEMDGQTPAPPSPFPADLSRGRDAYPHSKRRLL
jgi:hypothetical protein